MAESNFIHVRLRGIPAKKGVRAKSADIVRISPDLAMVNLEVAGESETVRIDLAKQVFLDSLGSKRLDAALEELKGPISGQILRAKPKREIPRASAVKAAESGLVHSLSRHVLGLDRRRGRLRRRVRYGERRGPDNAKVG